MSGQRRQRKRFSPQSNGGTKTHREDSCAVTSVISIPLYTRTDNTLFSGIDSVEEHARVRSLSGMTDALFDRVVAHGHAAAFHRGS